MITPEQRIEEFKERLARLLEEYEIMLEVRDVAEPGFPVDDRICLDIWTENGWLYDEKPYSLGAELWPVSKSLQTP